MSGHLERVRPIPGRLRPSYILRRMPVATYIVPNAKNVAQMNDGVCWWAGAMVLYQWAKASAGSSMVEPNSDSDVKQRWENNQDWPASNDRQLATKLKMKIQYD